MKKPLYLHASAAEVGAELQKSYDRILDTTAKWMEILFFDPLPETGMTPKDTVWRKNKCRLYHYINPNGIKHKTPLLMIYALINKAYILDLYPGMSLVEYLVNQGFDVYLLDWGEFDWEDRDLDYSQIVNDYVARAVIKVCQFSNVDELSILGYCMGGTIATMYTALFSRPKIKNMIFVAAPFDFEDAGLSSVWLQSSIFDVDKVTDTFSLIPKDFVDLGVKMLNPVNNFLATYTRLWKSIDEEVPIEAWKALNKWVNDNVNFPGRAYRQWVKYLYQENMLIKNEFIIQGRKVNLKNIDAALLVLTGKTDHIVLPHQSTPILEAASSQDKTHLEYNVGHGGLVFGSKARQEVYPAVSEWLGARS
ncbi:MAG: alpha/beta fold hydrolase [Syntrophomonas sp.]